jgi:hypothetical protein
MADISHIKERIAEIGQRRKNVELSDIQWVVEHLGMNGYSVGHRSNQHATLFRIGERQFSVCHHHRGSKQIKVCYVDDFLDVMEDLDLYEN